MTSEESTPSQSPDDTSKAGIIPQRALTLAGSLARHHLQVEEERAEAFRAKLALAYQAPSEPLEAPNQTSSAVERRELLSEPPAGDADCTKCNGLGFYRIERPLGHPQFGRAEACECYLEREKFRLAGIPKGAEYEGMTLDNVSNTNNADIDYTPYIDALRGLVDGADYFFVTLVGTSGLAKTHLAMGTVKYALERGIAATFFYTANILDQLKSLFDSEYERPEQRRDRIAELPFLVLDDFGVERVGEKASPWTREQLDILVNTRYVQHLPTIFTTNLEQYELPMRIYDRLFDRRLARVFRLEGASYRSGEQW